MVKKIRIKLSRQRLRSDWGAYFIIGFIVILLIAIFYYMLGSVRLAESMADYAYYALVIGVVLEILGFARHRQKERSFTAKKAV
jgi:hypothetical protein